MRIQRHPKRSEEPKCRKDRNRHGDLPADRNLRELEVVVVQQSFPRHQHDDQQPSLPRPRAHRPGITIAVAIGALALVAFVAAAPRAALTVDTKAFQLDGHPQFVVGVSLFDALGPAAPRDPDLDAVKSWGSNLVLGWAHLPALARTNLSARRHAE